MTLFESLALFGIVIIVCAVCLCAHYLQIIARRGDGGAKVATAAKVGGYARK